MAPPRSTTLLGRATLIDAGEWGAVVMNHGEQSRQDRPKRGPGSRLWVSRKHRSVREERHAITQCDCHAGAMWEQQPSVALILENPPAVGSLSGGRENRFSGIRIGCISVSMTEHYVITKRPQSGKAISRMTATWCRPLEHACFVCEFHGRLVLRRARHARRLGNWTSLLPRASSCSSPEGD